MVKIPEGLHKRQVVADFLEVFLDEYLIADSLAPGALISCDPGGLWLRAHRLAPQLLFDPPKAEDAEMDDEGCEHPGESHPRPHWMAVSLQTQESEEVCS